MDNSWVKLYRKLADNEVMYDSTALRVFIWLLLHVDKKTGEFRTGRFVISEALSLNPSTVYKILQRLEKKYKIVTLSSNNKFTTISLLNWSKYNQYEENVTQIGNNKVTTKEQQSNTIQEYRHKTNTISLSENQKNQLKKQFPYLDLDYEVNRFREWQKGTGKEFPNVLARFKAWLLQQAHEDKKESNIILEDPLFKQLQGVWRYNEGTGFIRKSDLQSRLGSKYPTYKYKNEWEEVKKVLSN